MAKKPIDSSGLQPLCHEFLLAANERSEGRLFKSYPHHDPRIVPGYAVHFCQNLFSNSFFQATFPAEIDQNAIGQAALKNSGVDYHSVRKALKAADLEPLMHILGHANRRP